MNIIDKYIEEALIFNDDDMKYKFEDWVSGKNKVLLVVGYAGSGKTTLGKELAKKHNVKYKTTDEDKIPGLDELWENLKKKHPDTFTTGSAIDTYSDEANEMFLKYAGPIVYKYINQIRTPTIWEGIHLLWWLTPEQFSKFSVLVKGTSHITSTTRAIKRNLKRNEGNEKNLPWYKLAWWTMSDNIKIQPTYNKLVRYLKDKK